MNIAPADADVFDPDAYVGQTNEPAIRLADKIIGHAYGNSSAVPGALTDYVKERQGYDYSHHGKSDNPDVEFVSDEIVDRFCLVGSAVDHVERLAELASFGVDQFALYLMHDGAEQTFDAYRSTVIPAAGTL